MANRLVLELLADSNGLLRGLHEAQRAVDRFAAASSTAGRELGGSVNRALSAFQDIASGGARAAGVLAGGLVALASSATLLTVSAAKQVEALDLLSQKTGIALQSIQRMSVVMAENNFDVNTLTSGMRTLSKIIVDARNPASQAAETFAEMGISITRLGSTEDALRAIADRFAAMPDGVDKSRLAVTLFGRAGLEMIPILNRGSAALDESARASERYGVVLSQQQAAALSAVANASDRLGVALTGLQQQLAATFAPVVAHGITAITEAIATLTNIVRNYSAALEQIKKEHPLISSWSPMIASGMAALRAAQMPPPPLEPGPGFGVAESHVYDFQADQAARQEQLGLRIRRQNLQRLEEQARAGRVQEALGRVLIQIEQTRQRNINAQLDALFEQEATYKMVTEQEELGWQIARQTLDAWQRRNDEIEMAVDRSRALDAVQQAMFRAEQGLFGASEAARRVRMRLIEDETALERRRIEETIYNETRKQQALENLDLYAEARRLDAIREFPTVFEQQMQTIVQSNAFSVGQIVSGWTSGFANAIVSAQNFGQAMKQVGLQTASTLLQGLLNFGVQMIAANALKNSAILASESATATATVAIWTGASAGIVGVFGTISGAIMGFMTQTLIPAFIAIGNALMAFLTAIAEAASATIFGIPYAVAILAGVAVIGGAIGALAAFAFGDGGIVTRPTLGLVGEAGSSEAVIPLNARGASFIRDAIGGNGRQEIINRIYLDGREIAIALSERQPQALRLMGAVS